MTSHDVCAKEVLCGGSEELGQDTMASQEKARLRQEEPGF